MKLIAFLICVVFALQGDAPFKTNDEFELKIDLQFKQRPHQDQNTV